MKRLTKRRRPQTQGGRKQAGNDARSKKAERQNAKKQAKSEKPSKANQLAEKAKSLRQAAEFSGQLRRINKLHRVEYDFGALTEEEAEFAAFWEYRREVEQWNVQPPTRIEGPQWEKWKNNYQCFPVPYLELKKARVLNLGSTLSAEKQAGRHPMWSDTPSPAFRESDPEEFIDMLAQPNHPHWSLIGKVGNMDAPGLVESDSGGYTPRRTDSLSMHCVVFDWTRGAKAIRDEMHAWLKRLASDMREDRLELRGGLSNREKLFQLGAWRARRAGLSAKEFYELRGGKRGAFGKSGNPSYRAPKAFRTAADAAEETLKGLLRKKVTE